MRGTGYEDSIATSIAATKPYIAEQRRLNRKKHICWKCQKEKSTVGGHLKMFAGGPMKFICKECLDKKKESNDTRKES